MPRPFSLALVVASIIAGAVAAGAEPAREVAPIPAVVGCPPGAPALAPSDEYKRSVEEALGSPRDVWGAAVLSRPNGPTYDAVKDYLRPAWWAIGPAVAGGTLTNSAAHYVPFGQPTTLAKRGEIALHVADGSQIISNRSGGENMTIYVGKRGERFGECLAHLAAPRLFDGYQPVLEVSYTDYDGVRYRQESFATFIPGTEILASYVKITANRAGSRENATRIRFDVCDCTLALENNQLGAEGRTHLSFSPGATFTGRGLAYELDLSDGADHSIYVVRLNSPTFGAPAVFPSEETHVAARTASIRYWATRLSEGATFAVPEPLVMNAQRNLLIQNLLMGWRYSLGNWYERVYQPESSDNVETLGRYGFTRFYRVSLEHLLSKSKGRGRRNWEMGEKLLRAADYYWLTRDKSFIDANMRVHARYAADLARQQRINPRGLLEPQQYSSDVTHKVYGLHQISRALFGLKAIIAVWRRTGHAPVADKYAPAARALDAALQRAVFRSTGTLGDGSLFTSVHLLGPVQPYDPITATRLGGYWNLVAPYGFASRIYPPGGFRARRTLQYLYHHGSRLLGGVRSRLAGIADGYGVEQAKFLADNDQADQLVLSLYGNLAHGRARGTFIAGESANVGPLAHKWPTSIGYCQVGQPCSSSEIPSAWSAMDSHRGLYNPPNSANNTLFLSILRTMLVQEVTDDSHVPQGLRLAFATPRTWLENGKDIAVNRAPTFFGPVSYRIHSALAGNVVTAAVTVPARRPPRTLELKLRVPQPNRMIAVTVNGRRHSRFDPRRGLINLTGLRGNLSIRVEYGASRLTGSADIQELFAAARPHLLPLFGE